VNVDDLIYQEKEAPQLPEWGKPDKCMVSVIEAFNVMMSECQADTIDIICTVFGVDEEGREKIKSGKCPELTKDGLTECICNSTRAQKAYCACRALWWLMQGEPLARAIRMAWRELDECGRDTEE